MLQLRKANERGAADHGWLKTKHTFSFADYMDSEHMGFRSLRVINEDHIAGGKGFGAHPHRDMEIITYVVKGALEHQDSMGNRAIIRPGEVQHMSAGSGVVHAEYNPQTDEEVHLLQIWILPKSGGGKPGYGQKSFDEKLRDGKLVLTASGDGRDGSIAIKQDADLYVSRLPAKAKLDFALRESRGAWLQVVRGSVRLNGKELEAGDGVSVEAREPTVLQIEARDASEFLLFDLA